MREVQWLLSLSLTIGSLACASPAGLERFEFTQIHMGVKARLVLYAADSALASTAASAAFRRIARLDSLLSDYRSDSELSAINRAAGRPGVRVDGDTYRVLEQALALAEETSGAFDPTVGPLVALWRDARRTGELPEADRLAEARSLVGWRHVALEPGMREVRLERAGMRLDLGAVAKGFACDEALATLRRHGIDRALIEFGGDIAAAEPQPGTDGWTIDVPGGEPIVLRNGAVATSGDGEQSVVIAGVHWSHVVDPRSGLGLTNRMKAVVIAADAATADAFATAVTVMTPRERAAFLSAQPQVRFILRRPEGG